MPLPPHPNHTRKKATISLSTPCKPTSAPAPESGPRTRVHPHSAPHTHPGTAHGNWRELTRRVDGRPTVVVELGGRAESRS